MMLCPVCPKEPMLVLELEGVEVDYCVQCQGIWLDAGELELLLDDAREKERVLTSFVTVSGHREKKRLCPVCLKKMEKVYCGEDRALMIDRCRNGHGLWFDRGELYQIVSLGSGGRTYKDHGVVARYVWFFGFSSITKEADMLIAGVVICIGGLIGFIVVVGIYNALVQLRNRVRNAWSQIDVQLKRRHDLIPNLVETAKGYMTHERETLETVTQARSQAMGAESMSDKSRTEGALGSALNKFLLVVENYPELKANQNFLALQEELTSTENKIAFSRQAYNDQVLFLNDKLQMFPSNIIAGMFHFRTEEFFEVENKEERAAPQVNFQ